MYLPLHGRLAGSNPVSSNMGINGLALDAKSFCWIFKSLPFALASVREKLSMRPPACLAFYGTLLKVII
jgi:hypothetical protein